MRYFYGFNWPPTRLGGQQNKNQYQSIDKSNGSFVICLWLLPHTHTHTEESWIDRFPPKIKKIKETSNYASYTWGYRVPWCVIRAVRSKKMQNIHHPMNRWTKKCTRKRHKTRWRRRWSKIVVYLALHSICYEIQSGLECQPPSVRVVEDPTSIYTHK